MKKIAIMVTALMVLSGYQKGDCSVPSGGLISGGSQTIARVPSASNDEQNGFSFDEMAPPQQDKLNQILNKFIKIHPDFTDLLFLTSLIDSQDIPKTLLASFKNKGIATSFAYNLKIYSLISDNPLVSFQNEGVFIMHRSTQEMVLSYLMEKLSVEQREQLMQNIVECLVKNMAALMKDESTTSCDILSRHALSLLGHKNLLSPESEAKVMIPLGNMLKYPVGNYELAKTVLREVADISQRNGDNKGAAKAFGYLGSCYTEDYKQAQFFLEQSLELDKSQDTESQEIRASNFVYLGIALKNLGEYTKSLDCYERSLEFWKNNKNDGKIARTQVYMAMTCASLKDFEKAKSLLINSLCAPR
ncbi:MAG: tetratricopeptide repeat protein [Alphaproteobacteria bacterium]|nr:tetratricopeptide repeat protein [Alphaproteobacteria bacterium]